MILSNEGFSETNFRHSTMSIFPSWFRSASKKVWPEKKTMSNWGFYKSCNHL